MMKDKSVIVYYEGKRYDSKPCTFNAIFDHFCGIQTYHVQEIPAKLQRYFYYSEDIKSLRLKSLYLVFDLEGEKGAEKAIFKIEEEGEIVFNKETFEVEEGFDFHNNLALHVIKDSTFCDILMFIENILKIKNQYVYDFMSKVGQNLKNTYFSKLTLLKNMYEIAINSTEGFEKIAKVNPRIVYKNIAKEEFRINNEGKINKVMELPKFAINYISKNKLENCVGVFQEVNQTDGNNLRILLEFFENMKVFVKSQNRPRTFYKFTGKLNELINDYDYRLKDLLSYLIKQSFYHSKQELFHFPLDEIIQLSDYLHMCTKHNLKYEKYPLLEREHNIAMKNIRILDNPARNDDFVNSVKKYAHLVSENDDYIIKVPESIRDMVLEGNYLHHCVADYVSKVIDGQSKIFFLRKKDEPEVPFVTIELDSDNLLVHTKGMYNEDPTGDVMAYIKRWVGMLGRRTKKTA